MNRPVDKRADLYSFGVMLYELLTGRLPFEGSDPLEWIHAHIAKTPHAPSQLDERIPASLDAIVLKLSLEARRGSLSRSHRPGPRSRALRGGAETRRHQRVRARHGRRSRRLSGRSSPLRARGRGRATARWLRACEVLGFVRRHVDRRLLGRRQVLARGGALPADRPRAGTVSVRQVRSVQARHSLRDHRAGVSRSPARPPGRWGGIARRMASPDPRSARRQRPVDRRRDSRARAHRWSAAACARRSIRRKLRIGSRSCSARSFGCLRGPSTRWCSSSMTCSGPTGRPSAS